MVSTGKPANLFVPAGAITFWIEMLYMVQNLVRKTEGNQLHGGERESRGY